MPHSRPTSAERAAPAAPATRETADRISPPQLTATSQRQLADYVATVARTLGLSDWILEVTVGDPGEDACAKVDAPYGQRRATITLGQLFLDQTPQDQRDTVVHELLHLVLMPSWQYIDELLDAELGVRAARIAWLGYTQHVEYSIDQLAATISPAVQLPPQLALQTGTPSFATLSAAEPGRAATREAMSATLDGALTDPARTGHGMPGTTQSSQSAAASPGAARPARRRVRAERGGRQR